MDHENISLILANVWLVGAFLSVGIFQWIIMIIISMLHVGMLFISTKEKIDRMKRQHMKLEVLHEIMKNAEHQRVRATKKPRSRKK